MASVVEICNRALQKLGAARIVDITDNSKNARSCNTAYNPTRLKELRRHTWNFAIKRASLPASVTPPLFDYRFAYPLPTDFLRLLAPDPISNREDIEWVIEGNTIVTNDSAPLQIRYVADITDPNLMDPLFREAVSADLAMELCEEITQSNEKKAAARAD